MTDIREGAETRPAPAASGGTGDTPHLKRGAIGYVSNLCISMASTAPAYTLAASVGFLVLTQGVGVHSPAVIIVSFLPIFCLASAYKYLNNADPDCGTAFSWAARAISPSAGFMLGWFILFSDIVGNAQQSHLVGIYTFSLFGMNGAANSTIAVLLVGIVFIVILTWICWRGIELSARTQQILLAIELGILLLFAVVALIKAYTGNHPGSVPVSISWFNPFQMSFGSLVEGMIIGVFFFWGWDTGVMTNEESENASTAPGNAAVMSTVLLIIVFLLVTTAAQAYGGTTYLANHPNDIFAGGLSSDVLGPLHFLLTIAVLLSTAAATQTTILPAARTALSMSRRGAIPAKLGEIHPRNLVPGPATIWAGIISVIWFIAISFISTNVLGDCVSGLGLLVCIYYAWVGFSCAIFYRREGRRTPRKFFTLLLMPVFGGVVLMGVMIRGIFYYTDKANDYSPPIAGLGIPDWIVIVAIVSGLAFILVRRRTHPEFWREPRMTYGDEITTVTSEAEFAPDGIL
jgi:amino acid transporter